MTKRAPPPGQAARTADAPSRRELLKLAGMGAALSTLGRGAFAEALGGAASETSGLSITPRMRSSHDLSLPDWGPYSKSYFGVTHVADVQRGISFDLSVFPVLAKDLVDRKKSVLPSVLAPKDIHPWESSTGIDFYTLRMELIWKDQLYCDLSFFAKDEHSRVLRMELANYTDKPQTIVLESLALLNYPPLHAYTAEPLRRMSVALPTGGVWVGALEDADLQFARPKPDDTLVGDGMMRGEERAQDAVDGSVIGHRFGADAGDWVSYRVGLEHSFANAVLVIRFIAGKAQTTFHLTGSATSEIAFAGTGGFTTVDVPVGKLGQGQAEFRFTSVGGQPVKLNGFAIVEAGQVDRVRFTPAPWKRDPLIDAGTVPGATILGYADLDTVYGIRMGKPLSNDRKLTWKQIDDVFGPSDSGIRGRRDGDPKSGDAGDPDSLFVNASSAAFVLEPRSMTIVYGLVATGTKDVVAEALRGFNPRAASNEALYKAARAKAYRPANTPAGEPYALSHRLLAAVTLNNLVFPIYTQREYIRQYTPGRCWDSLYTWDEGFHGLGLLELDPERAVDILNVYTMAPGSQSAFLLHGTPMPVQIYLFFELWNRTQSRAMLEYFYPRVLEYHRFMAGRLGSSTTRANQDKLICTWDYWYSSGGWDDYPPQLYVRDNKLKSKIAPAISSAHVIRCAKMLRMAADALGRTDDIAELDEDIRVLSGALQKYSWDAKAGYFSYVVHDAEGKPTGILRHPTGANWNMGLDGVAPLNAGICTPEQEKVLLEHIFSPEHLWTGIGITTIDQTAPYYNPNGYWNGCVWMAHQWFLWKTMLDLGRGDLALRIAGTGLNVWRRSTDETYQCFEHFSVKTGLGLGWPQFASLSSPVLEWFGAMYKPGRFTCGFEVWIEKSSFSKANRVFDATLRIPSVRAGRQFSVLACMDPGGHYRATWNGTPATAKIVHEGLLQIDLLYINGSGRLRIAEM